MESPVSPEHRRLLLALRDLLPKAGLDPHHSPSASCRYSEPTEAEAAETRHAIDKLEKLYIGSKLELCKPVFPQE